MRISLRNGLFLSVSFAVLLVFTLFPFTDCYCASDDASHALIVTDIHYNPFYDSSIFQELVNAESDEWATIFASSSITSMPAYGTETNFPLLDAALDSAAFEVPDPAFVIYTGDFLGHGFNKAFYALYGSEDETALQSFILKTMTFLADELRERFPEVPIFFTLGNNDAYLGDYNLDPGGTFLDETAQPLYEAFLEDRATCEDYSSTYKAGGYYRVDFGDIVVLSLNSVLFSYRRPDPVSGNAAWKQLDWFSKQLAKARKKGLRVVVVTHVPPGIDIYTTARSYLDENGQLSNAQLMWHEAYNEKFLKIVSKYGDVISVIHAGHSHMDEFRLVEGANGVEVPVEVTPSISPVFGNNPGYRVIELQTDGASIENYQAFTLPLQETSGAFAESYDFQEQYGLSAPDGTGLPELYTQLHKNASSKATYIAHYYGDVASGNGITDLNWPVYYCGIDNMRKDSMMDCVNKYNQPDILWRNPDTGKDLAWLMDGACYESLIWLNSCAVGWEIVGTGDFDQDGNDDIVWRQRNGTRNAIWYMEQTSFKDWTLFDSAPADWKIRGVGDFNADSNPDLVWRNISSGENCIWKMTNNTVDDIVFFDSRDNPWDIGGVGDFNDDGKPDLLWRNSDTGDNDVWFMDGSSVDSTAALTRADTVWSMAGVGDFNLDGQDDILWRRDDRGKNCYWYMTGTTLDSVVPVDDASFPWDPQGVGIFH